MRVIYKQSLHEITSGVCPKLSGVYGRQDVETWRFVDDEGLVVVLEIVDQCMLVVKAGPYTLLHNSQGR